MTCDFGICGRDAEFEVDVPSTTHPLGQDVMRVCGMHVTPVATWGVPDPTDRIASVRYLSSVQLSLPGLDELARRRGRQDAA